MLGCKGRCNYRPSQDQLEGWIETARTAYAWYAAFLFVERISQPYYRRVGHKRPRQIVILISESDKNALSFYVPFLFTHLSFTSLFLYFRAECSTTPHVGSLDPRSVIM
jgi:hypothetical protein